MSPINSHDLLKPGYYLPHHAVIKNNSITTKTRVIFDGSAKTSTVISLNETFMVGPTIPDDLYSIITRFRSFQYTLTADIQQMYRQILVSPEDQLFNGSKWSCNQKIDFISMCKIIWSTRIIRSRYCHRKNFNTATLEIPASLEWSCLLRNSKCMGNIYQTITVAQRHKIQTCNSWKF